MGSDFPVPRSKLPRVTVTPQEYQARKAQMERILAHAMDEYDHFREVDGSQVDRNRWKLVSARENLRLYRERQVGSGVSNPQSISHSASLTNSDNSGETEEDNPEIAVPVYADDLDFKRQLKSMRMIGSITGNLESALFSVITKSQEELALVNVFLHEEVGDCAVLATMEGPTAENPLHFLGYKWFVKKSPGGGMIVKNRDALYIEFCGLAKNKRGEDVGFLLMESVDLPSFPEMPERNTVRSLQSIRFLMRQRSESDLELFMTSVVEPSGRIFRPLTTFLTAESVFAITKVIDLAEARRLTKMIVQQSHARNAILNSRRHKVTMCTLCHQQSKFYNTTSLVDCSICGHVVCTKCRTYKRVFISEGLLGRFQRIGCCKTCVLVANRARPLSDLSVHGNQSLDRQNSHRALNPPPMATRPRSASDSSIVETIPPMSKPLVSDLIMPTKKTTVHTSARPHAGITLLSDTEAFNPSSSRINAAGGDRRRSDSTSSIDDRPPPMRAALTVEPSYTSSAPGGTYDIRGGSPMHQSATPSPMGASMGPSPRPNDLYTRMLELRRLAEDTYQTTRQNHLIMEQGAYAQQRQNQQRTPPTTSRVPARHLY